MRFTGFRRCSTAVRRRAGRGVCLTLLFLHWLHPAWAMGPAAGGCVFGRATGLAVDQPHGWLYVSAGHSLVRLTLEGRELGTWSIRTAGPLGVAPSGDLLVAAHHALSVLTASGRLVRRWTGSAGKPFGWITGVTVAPDGTIYVADWSRKQIDRLRPNGSSLPPWRSTGQRYLFGPGGVATDRAGNVYEVDEGNDFVQKLSPDGRLLARLGRFDAPPNAGSFVGPTAVAVGPTGDVYVIDYNFVARLTPAGRLIAVWGTATPGRGPHRFRSPASLAVDTNDNVYIADRGNHRLVKISASSGSVVAWSCR